MHKTTTDEDHGEIASCSRTTVYTELLSTNLRIVKKSTILLKQGGKSTLKSLFNLVLFLFSSRATPEGHPVTLIFNRSS